MVRGNKVKNVLDQTLPEILARILTPRLTSGIAIILNYGTRCNGETVSSVLEFEFAGKQVFSS